MGVSVQIVQIHGMVAGITQRSVFHTSATESVVLQPDWWQAEKCLLLIPLEISPQREREQPLFKDF